MARLLIFSTSPRCWIMVSKMSSRSYSSGTLSRTFSSCRATTLVLACAGIEESPLWDESGYLGTGGCLQIQNLFVAERAVIDCPRRIPCTVILRDAPCVPRRTHAAIAAFRGALGSSGAGSLILRSEDTLALILRFAQDDRRRRRGARGAPRGLTASIRRERGAKPQEQAKSRARRSTALLARG